MIYRNEIDQREGSKRIKYLFVCKRKEKKEISPLSGEIKIIFLQRVKLSLLHDLSWRLSSDDNHGFYISLAFPKISILQYVYFILESTKEEEEERYVVRRFFDKFLTRFEDSPPKIGRNLMLV